MAYHEIGHALVAAMQTHSAPVQKITIIPRTSGALGYTMQVEEGNHYLMTKEEIENKIATLTGGRAAEEVIVRLHLHRRIQRHRAGHQAGPGHDHPLRHERGLRHGGAGDRHQPVSGRRRLPGLLRGDPGGDRPAGGRSGEEAARKRRCTFSRKTGRSWTNWPATCTKRRPSPAKNSCRFWSRRLNKPNKTARSAFAACGFSVSGRLCRL